MLQQNLASEEPKVFWDFLWWKYTYKKSSINGLVSEKITVFFPFQGREWNIFDCCCFSSFIFIGQHFHSEKNRDEIWIRWELYDTVYTERYMGRPVDNPEGYNASTPLWHLDTLRNKKYYLIHGTHDDNVHYQQSMMLSAALEEKDILFKQQAYPDQDHSIGDYRKHLYHSLTSFFTDDCFRMLTQ